MISYIQGAIYVERFLLRLIQYYLLCIETVEPKIKLDQHTKFKLEFLQSQKCSSVKPWRSLWFDLPERIWDIWIIYLSLVDLAMS
jgi:hypothetical protein